MMGTAFSALVSPSPLRGEVKVGVSRPLQAQNLPLARHPHPSFPIMGEVPCSGRGTMLPQEWRPTSPLMGEAGRGWSHSHKSIHLIPVPKTSRILPPSPRMGGLQANSGGVGRVGALPLPQVRVWPAGERDPSPRIRDCSKNRHPEAASVSYLITYEAKAVSGSARLSLPGGARVIRRCGMPSALPTGDRHPSTNLSPAKDR